MLRYVSYSLTEIKHYITIIVILKIGVYFKRNCYPETEFYHIFLEFKVN